MLPGKQHSTGQQDRARSIPSAINLPYSHPATLTFLQAEGEGSKLMPTSVTWGWNLTHLESQAVFLAPASTEHRAGSTQAAPLSSEKSRVPTACGWAQGGRWEALNLIIDPLGQCQSLSSQIWRWRFRWYNWDLVFFSSIQTCTNGYLQN